MKHKSGIVIAILIMCMYLNIENVISIMLSDISDAFSGESLIRVQQIPSVIYFVEMIAGLFGGWFASKLSKRKIVILFQSGTVIGGMFAYFFGTSVAMLYVSAVIIGVSASIVSIISRAIVVENFSGNDVPKMIAASQIVNSLGLIMLQLMAGYLVKSYWRNGYLTYLFGIASILSAIFLLPEGPKERPAKTEKTKEHIWTVHLVHDVILTLAFLLINMTYGSNISYLIREKGLGDSVMTGYLSALSTAFVLIAAIVLPRTIKWAKNYCLSFSIAITVIGYIAIIVSPNIWFILLGSACTGFGQGTFTPCIFAHIAKHVTPGTNSSSHAFIQIAGNTGIYMYPYVITLPALLLGDKAVFRFAVAIPLALLLLAVETVYAHRHRDD